jgi:alpha-beta hydrolase superfamily lysophospholipase
MVNMWNWIAFAESELGIAQEVSVAITVGAIVTCSIGILVYMIRAARMAAGFLQAVFGAAASHPAVQQVTRSKGSQRRLPKHIVEHLRDEVSAHQRERYEMIALDHRWRVPQQERQKSSSSHHSGRAESRIVVIDGIRTDILAIEACTPRRSSEPATIFVIIPGNPGLADFYRLYMERVYALSYKSIDVLCISHAGHCPGLTDNAKFDLKQQIHHKISFVRKLLSDERKQHHSVRLVLAGHSVGAHICMEIMKALPGESVMQVQLLMPTVMHIGTTPNGRKLAPLFTTVVRNMVANLAWVLSSLPRKYAVRLLRWHIGEDSDDSIPLAACHLLDYHVAQNALYMAGYEMREINELDHKTFERNLDRIVFAFAEEDDWCPQEYYREIETLFPDANMHIYGEMRHAFVIGGSRDMATRSWQWIQEARADD